MINSPCRLVGCLLLMMSLPVNAVLFFSTGDPSYNSTTPVGKFANNGWQYQGAWAGFSGTAISSNCFITAKHVGGAIGQPYAFHGVDYPAVAFFDEPNSDLRIWQVSGLLPVYAPLYAKSNEKGKGIVVIGRGTQRGAEVRVDNRLKGWQWGPGDGVQRWGQNKIRAVGDAGPGLGDFLVAAFNAGGRNEAHLSGGDSGGAVYIKEGKLYKLAGINYGVVGPYSMTDAGDGFEAALFDERGLYLPSSTSPTGWVLIPTKHPGSFYATRISTHVAWINSIIATPLP